MRTFDSKAWTGRETNWWWGIGYRCRHFAFRLGWDFQSDWFGLRIAVGERKNPEPYERRYRAERFYRWWPRYQHYR